MSISLTLVIAFGITLVCLIVLFNIWGAIQFHSIAPSIPLEHLPISKPLPPVSVIIPCKGDQDGRLRSNLENMVGDAPTGMEIVFSTALADDPAQAVFKQFRDAHPHLQIKAVVAGIHPYGSEKNNNLLRAIEAADSRSEIFVFLDSDGKADGRLVQKLVSGLESGIAAVTGLNWYEPRWHVLPEVIRTVSNAEIIWVFADSRDNFLSGSTTAIRRKIFEEAGIPDLWARSIADDDSLSGRLRELGLKTRFMPNCIVLNSQKDSWSSLFQWLRRQAFTARVGLPRPFVIGFSICVGGNLLGYWLLFCGFTRELHHGGLVPSLIGVLWVVHFWLVGYLVIAPIQTMMKASGLNLKINRGMFIIVWPLVSLMEVLGYFSSLFMKRVTWAGVTYEVKNQITKRL